MANPEFSQKAAINRIKFFQKHIVEQKTVTQCAKEMSVGRQTLQTYKKSEDFRQMAVAYFDDTTLGGLKGTVSKLVDALDAERPEVMTDSIKDPDGSIHAKTRIEMVPDNSTRLKALQEVIKIYGLHAPTRKDVAVTVSLSSDAEIFGAIEQAARDCRIIESDFEGQGGTGVAQNKSKSGGGDFATRERTLLQDAPLLQPVEQRTELAAPDNMGHPAS